jgi:hypothetical protein
MRKMEGKPPVDTKPEHASRENSDRHVFNAPPPDLKAKGIEQDLLRAALQRSKTPIKLQIPLAPTALQVPFGTRYMGSSPGRHKKGQELDMARMHEGRVTPYARRNFHLAWQALRFELHLVFVYRLTCLRSNVVCISTSTSPRTSNPNIPRNHPPRPAAYKRRAIRHGVCKFQQRKAR